MKKILKFFIKVEFRGGYVNVRGFFFKTPRRTESKLLSLHKVHRNVKFPTRNLFSVDKLLAAKVKLDSYFK